MLKKITVQFPADLLARAKRKAAAEGRTLNSLIEEGLRVMLDEQHKPMPGDSLLPRVSKATGGLMPGVDLTRFSDYQEMEDLEYIERLKQFK